MLLANVERYFPDLLKEVREFQKIAEAENPELLFLWDELGEVLDDQFIDTATKEGVSRREKMIGISSKASDTLDERKFRLFARYNENIPYTLRALEGQLATLCGDGGYRLEIAYGAFSLKAKLELTNKKNVDVVGDMLERMVPANMVLKVELLYNQHQLFLSLAHKEMQVYHHLALREEVIING